MNTLFRKRDGKKSPEFEYETKQRDDLMEDDDEYDSIEPEKKAKSKRPKENAFTQQKLRAFHPILTVKEIVPLLVILSIIFIPIGASMLKASNNVQDFTIDYAHCSTLANSNYWTQIPDEYYTFNFKESINLKPQWKLSTNDSYIWSNYPEEQKICQIQFEIPNDLSNSIYLFYQLTNFHANHRRYVISFAEDQLTGKVASIDVIKDTIGQNCQPLSVNEEGKIYYPCGLIANSMFNDTFSSTLTSVNGSSADNYEMTNKGIAWSSNKDRYKKTKYNPNDIVPPPNWIKLFPDGYNETNLPDLQNWEEFQNWMSTAALSDFSKLALRNDSSSLLKGTYQIEIGLHFPTTEYNGGKKIYLSTTSAIGGKNDFLGISWIVAGSICLGLSIIFMSLVLLRGRRSADPALLSWNK
ncbi:Lem3 protein [Martiniozyma asiatica (nom. inval.)]|nr:Lem3 protein [Martiniozyma asiatica]